MPFSFPEELLHSWMLHEAAAWINEQPVVRLKMRKYMIIEWCKIVGVPLTGRIVKMVYTE